MPSKKEQSNFPNKAAAIDIGSNSVLLSAISFSDSGKFKILKEIKKTLRISLGVSENLKIRPDAQNRLIACLHNYKNYCTESGIDLILCTGTEVFRKANNSPEVKKIILDETGLDLRILKDADEARLSFISATEELKYEQRKEAFVIDLGGGSTEIVTLKNDNYIHVSIKIGSLFLKEKFKLEYPITEKIIMDMKLFIKKELVKNNIDDEGTFFVGVGGTITTIPLLLEKMHSYDKNKIDLYKIEVEKISGLIDSLKFKTLSQLEKMTGMPEGRADILLPGLLILYQLMKMKGIPSLLIRNRGLRFGLLFDHIKKHYPKSSIIFS